MGKGGFGRLFIALGIVSLITLELLFGDGHIGVEVTLGEIAHLLDKTLAGDVVVFVEL